MFPLKNIIALVAMLCFPAACLANDRADTLGKEVELMMDACRELNKVACADVYLKKRRKNRVALRGQVLPEQVMAPLLAGWMLQMVGEVPDAEAEYKLALALSKRTCGKLQDDLCKGLRTNTNSKIAQFYIDEKRYAEALALLHAVELMGSIEEKSHMGDAMVAIATQLGDAFAGLRRYADAEKAYLRAKKGIDERDSNWHLSHWEYWPGQIDDVEPDQLAVRMASAYQRDGKHDQAMRTLAPVLASTEKSSVLADALNIAAINHLRNGEAHEAQQLTRRAIALHEEELRDRCTVRWTDAEKLALLLKRLASICRSGVCKQESASLDARATEILAASTQRPLLWNRQRCK